jgi:hypothetical protein
MNKKEYEKHKKEVTKLVTEAKKICDECSYYDANITWDIDDSNYIILDKRIPMWDEDRFNDIVWFDRNYNIKLSKGMREIIMLNDIFECDGFEINIVKPLNKIFSRCEKKFDKIRSKLNIILENINSYDVISDLSEGVSVEEIVKDELCDIEVEPEVLLSTDKKEWHDGYGSYVESFLEDYGVENGEVFYIKTDGVITEHTAFVEAEPVYYYE